MQQQPDARVSLLLRQLRGQSGEQIRAFRTRNPRDRLVVRLLATTSSDGLVVLSSRLRGAAQLHFGDT